MAELLSSLLEAIHAFGSSFEAREGTQVLAVRSKKTRTKRKNFFPTFLSAKLQKSALYIVKDDIDSIT